MMATPEKPKNPEMSANTKKVITKSNMTGPFINNSDLVF